MIKTLKADKIAKRRELIKNEKRSSIYILKLKRKMMRSGNYQTICNILTTAFVLLKERIPEARKKGSVNYIITALKELEPRFQLRTSSKSGRKFFIPCPCRKERRVFHALNFFFEAVENIVKREGVNYPIAIMKECVNINKKKDSDAIRKSVMFMENVLKYKHSAKFLKIL